MPTQPSRAAIDLSDQLLAAGFVVTPRLVESWRARGLLGRWTHVHRGGPGSAAQPAVGAFERARLTARLKEKDRDSATVTLLAVATGAPVESADVRAAIAKLYEPILTALGALEAAEPADRGDRLLSALTASRRGGDALRDQARTLTGSPDPQRPPFGDRTTFQRAYDTYCAIVSALAGDSQWITPALSDALRLVGMQPVAELLSLEEEENVAELGGQVEDTIGSMVSGLADLQALSAEDVNAVQMIFAGVEDIDEFAMSKDPISEPGALVSLTANTVLSQLVRPGQLRDGLLAAWAADRSR